MICVLTAGCEDSEGSCNEEVDEVAGNELDGYYCIIHERTLNREFTDGFVVGNF